MLKSSDLITCMCRFLAPRSTKQSENNFFNQAKQQCKCTAYMVQESETYSEVWGICTAIAVRIWNM